MSAMEVKTRDGAINKLDGDTIRKEGQELVVGNMGSDGAWDEINKIYNWNNVVWYRPE